MATAKEREVKHTPTPWIAGYGERLSDGSDCRVIDSEEGSIAEMMCPKDVEDANAEFIVRAVNNHDALCDLLARARWFILHSAHKLADEQQAKATSLIEEIAAALAAAQE